MKRLKDNLLIWGGIVLITASLCISLWGIWDEYRAARSADQALEALESQRAVQSSQAVKPVLDGEDKETVEIILEEESQEVFVESSVSQEGREMPVVAADGIEYIGVLDIPALELEFSIISQWSEESLKIAPCRYMGSAYSDDLIIAGHNYKRHFNGLRRLKKGDGVYLTDMEGNYFSYQVTAIEKIPGTAIEEMEAGQWDLTLFTCTPGGGERLTVRCQRLKE